MLVAIVVPFPAPERISFGALLLLVLGRLYMHTCDVNRLSEYCVRASRLVKLITRLFYRT
jgi:hypothetical protein